MLPSKLGTTNRQPKRSRKPVPNEPKVIDDEPITPTKRVKVAECSDSGLRMRIVRENVDEQGEADVTGGSSTPKTIMKNTTSLASTNTSPTIAELLQHQSNENVGVVPKSSSLYSNNSAEKEDNAVENAIFDANVLLRSDDDTDDYQDEDLEEEKEEEEELSDVGEELAGAQKKQRIVEWMHERTFDKNDELQEYLKKENCWSLRSSSDTIAGRKILYRCNKVKRMSEIQCAASVYVIERIRYTQDVKSDVAGNNVDDDANESVTSPGTADNVNDDDGSNNNVGPPSPIVSGATTENNVNDGSDGGGGGGGGGDDNSVVLPGSANNVATSPSGTSNNVDGSTNNEKNDGKVCTSFMLYRKSCAHNHDKIAEKNLANDQVSDRVKQMVVEQYKNGRRPKKISYSLLDDPNVAENEKPSYKQVVQIINSFKKTTYGDKPLTMRQLTELVTKHMDVPLPTAIDEAFVLSFEKSPRNVQGDDKYFRFFISTRRLLAEAANGKIVLSDSTHKVTTDNVPLIAVGVVDYNRKFHFTGLTLANHEAHGDYAMTFNAMKKGIHLVTGIEMRPTVLVCDSDPAIHNGFAEVFGDGIRSDTDYTDADDGDVNVVSKLVYDIVMCYFHVHLNIQSKYKFVNSRGNKAAFKADITTLHLSDSEHKFNMGCAQFVNKWKDIEPEATRLVRKSFFKKNKNWYIGFLPRVPKHNNNMETFNSSMKRCQLEHKRQPLKQFFSTALAIVRQRSKEYVKDKLSFAHELQISEALMQKGRQLSTSFVHELEKPNGDIDFFMFRSDIKDKITLKDVTAFKNGTYKTFEEFADKGFTIWKITFSKESCRWMEATCTCPAFDGEWMCKHIIFLAHTLGILNSGSPEEADFHDEPLFVTKRGRPKKISHALVLD